jgi:LemA protein
MKRLLGCGVSTVVMTVVVVALVSWAVLTYVGLTRREIGVEASWARMENTWQRRMDLVSELIDRGRSSRIVDNETLEHLTTIHARVSTIVLTPEILNMTDRFVECQRLQAELSDSLSGPLGAVDGTERVGLDAVARELRSAQAQIVRHGTVFNDRVDSYNEHIDRFPVSVIARLFDFTPKPPLRLRQEEAPVVEASTSSPEATRAGSRSDSTADGRAGL